MKLTRKEYEEITAKIEKLAGEAERLQKQIDEAEVEPERLPEAGDVWKDASGEYMLVRGGGKDSMFIYFNGIGSWDVELHPHQAPKALNGKSNEYVGKFEEVYFTREQLKAKFEKMGDLEGELPSEHDGVWAIGRIQKSSFIDNLLDDKNCDGSPVA